MHIQSPMSIQIPERIDVRKLEAAARQQMREIVLRLQAQGYGSTAIADMLGLRRPTVSDWLRRIREGLGTGERKRGRRVGTGRRLTPVQEARILQDITTQTPDRLGLPYALWNAQAVRDLIRRYFGRLLPKRTVRLYLQRWGSVFFKIDVAFSFMRPSGFPRYGALDSR